MQHLILIFVALGLGTFGTLQIGFNSTLVLTQLWFNSTLAGIYGSIIVSLHSLHSQYTRR